MLYDCSHPDCQHRSEGSARKLQDAQPVAYITSQGEELLKGTVRIDPDPSGTSGILCACCDAVISCSQFEAHAGRGSRRAPYDNIFTADGLSLRKVCLLPQVRKMQLAI